MGMYTELRVNCRLKAEVPEIVVRVLQYMADGDLMAKPAPFERPDHPLFDCPRWSSLMRCSSAYFDDPPSAAVVKWNGQWHVLSVANLKNYSGEIERFLDWLAPHVDAEPGEVWAQHRYEEFEEATDVAA